MSNILCLSGWGQKFDSLEKIFHDQVFLPFSVSSLDYSLFNSAEDLFFYTSSLKNPKILVGWSLGGQLAIRLIEKEIFAPQLLILLAPPFLMIKDERISAGMSQTTFNEFYQNFSIAPNQTLKKFAILTAMNDRNANEIAKNLDINDQNFEQLQFWLEELSRFSCFTVDFTKMPRTLYFHGAGDMIVHINQAEYFKNRIKNFRTEIFKNCGHAPHLSNLAMVRKIISEEIAALN